MTLVLAYVCSMLEFQIEWEGMQNAWLFTIPTSCSSIHVLLKCNILRLGNWPRSFLEMFVVSGCHIPNSETCPRHV